MNTFKKKSLYVALAGAGALGVTGAAQAVNVNPDGLGSVLIYPYYTANDKIAGAAPFASLLSVVNSTGSVKALKVRFVEGRNSFEVLDFNLFLSPYDVWTAAVLPTADGGAGVGTLDNSCTVPSFKGTVVGFVNYAYAGDGAGDGLERTKEGYVGIIEMGDVTDADVIKEVTHVAGKASCEGLTGLPSFIVSSRTGGLFGSMTLINVLAGEDYTEDAIALENFNVYGTYVSEGSINPQLKDVWPPFAIVTDAQYGGSLGTSTVIGAGFNNSIDAISALFMRSKVYNEYVLDSNTKSGTDWVVTFPTKSYYYNFGNSAVDSVSGTKGTVSYLFQNNWDTKAGGACDDVNLIVYDREEQSTKPGFSPPKPNVNTLCWEANVITFNGTNVLGSKNTRTVVTGYQNGWASLEFPYPVPNKSAAHVLKSQSGFRTDIGGYSTGSTATFFGLPVIGFSAQTFNNGTLTDSVGRLLQSNYGGNLVHKTQKSIILNYSNVVGAQ